jgi:hypothetical protein
MAELFDDFEINRTPRWPRLSRALAGSLVLHGLLTAAVVYVPTLQSMLHIAGMFSGADYVAEDYEMADIRERATMIQLAPQEKLYYPPGYFSNSPFAPPAPVEAQVIEEARVIPTPRPTPRPTPQATPTPAPSPTPDASATPEVAAAVDAKSTTGEAVASSATPADELPKTEEELKKLAERTNTKRFPKINVQPFRDLLKKSKEMMDTGELDLNGTIKMTVEADRNDDGTLSNITITKVSTTNEKLKALVIEFVQALGASRALVVLEGTSHLTMEVESDPSRVSAVVTTTADTPQRASDMALGYNGALALGMLTKSGKDEAEIYKNTKVSASGKNVTMIFGMSRPAVAKMLEKQVKPS